MDSFQFDFDTDSTLTSDTTSTASDLDWTAFQSSLPTTTNQDDSPFSTCWLSPGDDAVAPDNRSSTIIPTTPDDGIYFEIEHFFNGFNQQSSSSTTNSTSVQEESPGIIQPIHVNIQIPDQVSSPTSPSTPITTTTTTTMTNNSLPSPLVPRLSSSRSQCYHKLPDHAVKLMQEWYNANLDDPYPRSPDKKRFITEGNITAQQCRSWFANRRQRLKHVKRNHPRASSSNSAATSSSSSNSSTTSLSSRLHQSNSIRTTRVSSVLTDDQQGKNHEHCYYCQQQQQQQQVASPSPLPLTLTSTGNSATTLNVVINQQTVEQLIHNSLRKLLYPVMM